MDQQFDIDDHFERMLKEKCDAFRMYPSKRVWHSIYNNIHPGRRWPSIAMSITLIAVLLVVGYINADTVNNNSLSATKIQSVTLNSNTNALAFHTNNIAETEATINLTPVNPVKNKTYSEKEKITTPVAGNKSENHYLINIPATIYFSSQPENIFIADRKKNGTVDYHAKSFVNSTKKAIPGTKIFLKSKPETTNKNSAGMMVKGNGQEENYAIQNNKAAEKKWADKLKVQLYAMPSFVYTTLSNDMVLGDNNAQQPVLAANESNMEIDHKPALGLEAGAAMQYSLNNIIKVKAGLQFNYTSYYIQAFGNNFASPSTLLVDDVAARSAFLNANNTSSLSSFTNMPVTISNKTYQLSLPVGVELKVAGNESLQFNIGATIQPSFIMGDNASMDASGKDNFANTPSLLNQWNLNAGFETFVSYKINGLTWQLGPQFRRQLSSTFDKKYTVSENLNNYGLKFGVTKTLE